jgi:hypothetical protein
LHRKLGLYCLWVVGLAKTSRGCKGSHSSQQTCSMIAPCGLNAFRFWAPVQSAHDGCYPGRLSCSVAVSQVQQTIACQARDKRGTLVCFHSYFHKCFALNGNVAGVFHELATWPGAKWPGPNCGWSLWLRARPRLLPTPLHAALVGRLRCFSARQDSLPQTV